MSVSELGDFLALVGSHPVAAVPIVGVWLWWYLNKDKTPPAPRVDHTKVLDEMKDDIAAIKNDMAFVKGVLTGGKR